MKITLQDNDLPGLARIALATPAMEPAKAVSLRDSGNGEIKRRDAP